MKKFSLSNDTHSYIEKHPIEHKPALQQINFAQAQARHHFGKPDYRPLHSPMIPQNQQFASNFQHGTQQGYFQQHQLYYPRQQQFRTVSFNSGIKLLHKFPLQLRRFKRQSSEREKKLKVLNVENGQKIDKFIVS
jgi:hypothetical protein